MKPNRLLFGPLAAVLFVATVAGLAAMLPGYNHVHQTVSEIGEMDSPMRVPFAAMLFAVAACIFVFALGLREICLAAGHSPIPAYLAGCMTVSIVGVAYFASPHPLHNVFGLSELVAYQAPAAFALSWRRERRARALVFFSWLAFIGVWTAILLNLSSLDPQGIVWAHVRPVIGIAQRALFGIWFGWVAVIGLALRQRPVAAVPGAARP